MLAHDLISKEIPSLGLQSTCDEALMIMQEYGVIHLPVCEGDQLIGIVTEESLIKSEPGAPLESVDELLTQIYCHNTDHLFEVMKKIADADLTLIPVVNNIHAYTGCILRDELYEYYNKSFAWSEPGSIIVIHFNNSQYSLSEISHIIEAENATVLSSIVSRPSDNQLVLTLKVNKIDISKILAALRRYDYDVSAFFSEEEVVDNFKERYDALMRFLDV